MPLPNPRDIVYRDGRAAMLNHLNDLATQNYISNPEFANKLHANTIKSTQLAKNIWPEQFRDLQDQNTDAKIKALNELDFMDMDPRHANNPVAQLGSQDANIKLRMPLAWADQLPDIGNGGARGFYATNPAKAIEHLTIPMKTMTTPDITGRNTVTHEVMHRGFNQLGNPVTPTAEHNYIYNKMHKDYNGPNSYPPHTVNTQWESRPGSRYDPMHVQEAYNKKQATRFETAARNKLGTK